MEERYYHDPISGTERALKQAFSHGSAVVVQDVLDEEREGCEGPVKQEDNMVEISPVPALARVESRLEQMTYTILPSVLPPHIEYQHIRCGVSRKRIRCGFSSISHQQELVNA